MVLLHPFASWPLMAVSQMCLIYLFGVLHRFQHCTGHIMMGSWKGRGNQYIQLVKVLYCQLPTSGKQLSPFPLEVGPETEPQSQRWEARVLPLCHRGPSDVSYSINHICYLYNLNKCNLNMSSKCFKVKK